MDYCDCYVYVPIRFVRENKRIHIVVVEKVATTPPLQLRLQLSGALSGGLLAEHPRGSEDPRHPVRDSCVRPDIPGVSSGTAGGVRSVCMCHTYPFDMCLAQAFC